MTDHGSLRASLEESFGTHILPEPLREDLYSAAAGCPETYRLWVELCLRAYEAGRASMAAPETPGGRD